MDNLSNLDIFDLLPESSFEQIDNLGIDFLRKNGIKVENLVLTENVNQVKRQLKRKNLKLVYNTLIDEDKNLLFFYSLTKKGISVADSNGIKFVARKNKEEDERELIGN